jgi:hypothetical protein
VSPGTDRPPVPRVFICYRREDTAAHAGRLYDAMASRFGERNVFMDVDIAPGVDFVEHITEVVSGCQVLIVVMGPNWATVEDEDGAVRIADPDDFVRLEVETALRRPDVTPIPVLVSEARMPKREDLPPELRPLARRNALEMSNSRWRYDVDRLNNTLDALLTDLTRSRENVAPPTPVPEPLTPIPPAPEPATPVPDPPTPIPPLPDPPEPARSTAARSGTSLILEGMALAIVTALVARSLALVVPDGESDLTQILGVIVRRAETWALTGAALSVWLALRTGRHSLARAATTGLLVGALAGAIGGAVWAIPSLLPNPDPVVTELAKTRRIEIAALAVTGGLLGAMIGAIWRPARPGAGLLAGIAAGVLFQLAVIASGWLNVSAPPKDEIVLAFALMAAAVAGLTIGTLVTLDTRQGRVPPPLPARNR